MESISKQINNIKRNNRNNVRNLKTLELTKENNEKINKMIGGGNNKIKKLKEENQKLKTQLLRCESILYEMTELQ